MLKTKWQWKSNRWWIGLIIFWFVSTGGAGLIARSGGSYGQESGFIILVLLILAIFAASTDREWGIPLRVAWVFAIWIIQALLATSFVLPLIGPIIYSARPDLVDRAISFTAAMPLAVWAMRRSTFFVERAIDEDVQGESSISTPV